MTAVPLTPVEAAAAEALAAHENDEIRRDHGVRDGRHSDGTECIYDGRAKAADWEDEARAVVAAVRSQIEAEVLDALADTAEDYGPPSTVHLRGMAFIARQGRSIVDWLADDHLPLPASKETQQ